MIEKLEKLKTTLEAHTSGDKIVTKELYDLLLSELNSTQQLLRLVENKRNNSLLRVDLGDLISEKIDEFSAPEMGFTKDEISSIRVWLSEEYYKSADYDLRKDRSKEAMNYKKAKKILNKGPEIPKRLDAFEKKSKGMVIVYDVLQDCYMNEFFKNMNCNNYEETIQSFGPMTINLMQIDWLFKNEKLLLETEYVILASIDGKFLFLKVYCHRGETVNWFPTGLSKGKKLLLFSPTDIDTEEKYFLK